MCDCSDLITKVADEIYIKIEKVEEDIAWIKDNQHKIDEHGRNRYTLLDVKLNKIIADIRSMALNREMDLRNLEK